MWIRRRRRLDLVLLAVAVLLVGVAVLIGATLGSKERISTMWVGAEVSADGSARITELIDWDYGVHHRHGILRDVPGLPVDAPITVSSGTAPPQYTTWPKGSETEIRIGDPDRTVSGRHRYRILYPLADVAPGRLAWDAVGTGWPVTISQVEIHVATPFEVTAPSCVQHVTGSQTPCRVTRPEPGHLVVRIDRLNSHEGVTLSGTAGRLLDGAPRLQPPASDLPARGGGGLVPAGLLAAAAALIGAVLVAAVIGRAGRERVVPGAVAAGWAEPGQQVRVDLGKPASLPTTQASPPAELTPEQGGVLLAEAVRDEHRLAWLVRAAADGYLDIDQGEFGCTLQRRPRPEQADRRDPLTAAEVSGLFGSGMLVTLLGYDARFADTWQSVARRLEKWQKSCGLWDPVGERRCRVARAVGGLAAAVGLAVLGLGGVLSGGPGAAWPAVVGSGAAVAGAGLAALIVGWKLRLRTPAGADLWARTESFRRYPARSEGRHAEDAAGRGLLLHYTAWAVAVGQADRWSRAVAESSVPPNHPGAHLLTVLPHLPAAAHKASNTPHSRSGRGSGRYRDSSTDSSSGGSGFSGGSGGGGGGSGGGGSW